MCKCGCNSCETESTALVLKENKFVHTPISEGLKYHIDNKIPLSENIYRIGSKEYMKLYSEARSLYSRGKLDVSEDDKYFLTETHVGNFGMFEGKRIPLDIPMLKEGGDVFMDGNKVNEYLNESMIGIKTKANFKPLQLKGALERAGIKGFRMDRLSWSLTALKLDKKYFNDAKQIIKDLGLSIMMAKESKINENIDVYDILKQNRDKILLDYGPQTYRTLQTQLMKDDEAWVRSWLVNKGYMDEEKLPFEESLNEEITDEEMKREYDNILSREYHLTRIYTDNRSPENWEKLSNIRKKGRNLEKKLADKGLIPSYLKEKLCKKGEAYRKRRMAAGEKSSAYLSGRAVKVCKGQMSGKKKKKANENTAPNHDGKAAPYGSGYKILNIDEIAESLRDWFKKENWVRINTSGNISGDCGTMKKDKATTRCLPKKKAQSMTKAERKATVAKKVRGSKKGKQFVSVDEVINEAKKKKKTEKKDPPIGKPKRGGSKAYYVYVRDPKTKKVKKVSFGSGGLRAKIRNPKARKAFAARHNCKNKKDRTKAGYWSCNLPRYAPQLGLGAKMNTFW
jgi:hypothetical protein